MSSQTAYNKLILEAMNKERIKVTGKDEKGAPINDISYLSAREASDLLAEAGIHNPSAQQTQQQNGTATIDVPTIEAATAGDPAAIQKTVDFVNTLAGPKAAEAMARTMSFGTDKQKADAMALVRKEAGL